MSVAKENKRRRKKGSAEPGKKTGKQTGSSFL